MEELLEDKKRVLRALRIVELTNVWGGAPTAIRCSFGISTGLGTFSPGGLAW